MRRWIILGILLCLMPTAAFAQVGTVEGVVIGPDGVPVPGANVALQGTTTGTATDAEGEFSFTAPAGDHTLVVTFIGYADYTAPITVFEGDVLELSVQLEEGAIDLDEIVVTALGIQREERSLGYSFQEVDNDLVQRANESNLVNALAGKVAGVQVTSSSGQPGKAARITIRGNSSLTGNNQPLFIVDGVPISNDEDDNPQASYLFTGGTINRAVDLDPSLIEDITVLKGAAAMALYGSRAANGAVVITTKGGQSGVQQPTRVTFSSTTRWDDAVVEGYQTEFAQGNYGCFYNGLPAGEGGFVDVDCVTTAVTPLFEATGLTPEEAAAAAAAFAASANPQTVASWGPRISELNQNEAILEALDVDRIETFNPREEFYQTGLVSENSLSVSGGALGGNYFLSGSYLDQGGIVPNTLMDRYSAMAKFGANLTDQFRAETMINYVRTENDWAAEGNTRNSYLYNLNFAPPTFDINTVSEETGELLNYSTAFNNPFWVVDNVQYTSDVDRFIGSVRLAYDFLPWLTLSEQAGVDTYTDTRKGMVEVGTAGTPNGSLYDQGLNRREMNSDLILQAQRKQFGQIGLSALVGNQVNYQYYAYNYLQGTDLGVPGFFNIDNAATITGSQYQQERMLVGLYSQATVDYDDWAYLMLTARNDWSSTLPAENNSYFYPSVSTSLVFTEAVNMFESTPLSFGKLRASWARIGNDAPVYSTSTTFIQADVADAVRGDIDFPFNGVNAYQRDLVLGNPELEPELSSEYEVGLDLRFFGQRARLDAAYYDRTTTGQIFEVPLSATTGYVERLLNAGEVRNRGVELFFSATPVQTRDFAWDLAANWSNNETEVVELYEGVESIYLAGFTNPQIRIMEGEGGYGVIWGEQFVYADPEEHADLFEANPELQEGMLLVDEEGLPVIAPELGPVGNVQPDWLANLRSSFTYKGLSLSGLLDIRRGGEVLNMDLFYTSYYGTSQATADRDTEFLYEGFNVDTGEINDVPVLRDRAYYQNFFANYAPNWVEDGSFIKLRELSLSYTLPVSWTRRGGVESATITATGRNLWIDSDFSLGDPEGSLTGAANAQGFYHAVTPSTRSYALGVRLSF